MGRLLITRLLEEFISSEIFHPVKYLSHKICPLQNIMCESQGCQVQCTLQYRSFFLSTSRDEVAAHFRGYGFPLGWIVISFSDSSKKIIFFMKKTSIVFQRRLRDWILISPPSFISKYSFNYLTYLILYITIFK